MSGRVKIKSKDKDKKPKVDVFKIIEDRFKNMNELRDLIDMNPRKGLVRIRDGAGFREVERGGPKGRGLPPSLGITLSLPLLDSYHENFSHRHKIHIPNKDQLLYNYRLIYNHHPNLHNFHLKPESVIQICK